MYKSLVKIRSLSKFSVLDLFGELARILLTSFNKTQIVDFLLEIID